MPASRFKIYAVGAPVGAGVTNALNVAVSGIAKTNSQNMPHVVLNELLCSNLARVLFLPTPPGFIIDHAGAPHFVSLNFNLAGQALPPVNPAALVAALPLLAAGTVVFDIWVVNADRHRRNVAFDTTTNRMQIFDHSHAFYGFQGLPHLTAHAADLGINHMNQHCLAPHLTSLADLRSWCDHARSVPDYYVASLIQNMTEVGLPQADVGPCTNFMIDRRDNLFALISNHAAAFPNIPAANWNQGNRVQP